MTKPSVFLLVLTMVLSIPIIALADAGWRPQLYGPMAKRQWLLDEEHPTIAMVREEVLITLNNDNAKITASFDFKNTGNKTEAVEMFFPLDYDFEKEEEEKTNNREEYPASVKVNDYGYYSVTAKELYTDFSVTVDGKPCNCGFEKKYIDDMYHEEAIHSLAIWSVDFTPSATRRVVCSYTSTYGYTPNAIGPTVDYLLYTGTTWHGAIGYGKITVRPGNGFDWSIPLSYKGTGVPPAHDEGDAIVWEFNDLEEPDSIITVYFPRKAGLKNYSWGESYDEGFEGHGGVPARVETDNLNFRRAPDASADKIAGQDTFKKGSFVKVHTRKGDWYRVKYDDRIEGWVRWRYVDPDTGEEHRYIHLMEAYD